MSKRFRKFTVQTDVYHPDTGDAILSEEKLKEVLESKNLKKWAYVLHDSDSSINKEGHEVKRAPHWHIVLWAENASTHSAVGKWFNLESNFVEHIKSEWGAMITYLTHELEEEKHRYEDDEIVANFDWKKDRDDYLQSRDEKISQEELDKLYRMCTSGEIREYDHHKHIPPLVYIKNEKLFKTAFDYFMTTKAPEKRVPKRILFVAGVSGSGKTRLSQELAERQGEKPFISSAGNDVMDGYKGERVVIFDDFRGENWTIEQLLKLTDPYADSKTWSRYKSKSLSAAETIIFTFRSQKNFPNGETIDETPNELVEFFELFKGSESEPIKQWTRRVEVFVRVVSEEITITKNKRSSYFYVKKNDNVPSEGWKLRAKDVEVYEPVKESLDTEDFLRGMGLDLVGSAKVDETSVEDETNQEPYDNLPF